MERKKEYQIRVLPPDSRDYITLDSEPRRKSQANIIYKIEPNVFEGINEKMQTRKRARDFANLNRDAGKTFAVILIDEDTPECLYFCHLYEIEREYPKPHTQYVMYLTRCTGVTTSKKHWKKVNNYILSHAEDILMLEVGDKIIGRM